MENAAIDMKISTSIDKVKAAQAKLKSDPNAAAELKKDPTKFLRDELGIDIDEKTLNAIKSATGTMEKPKTKGAAPAGFVHIDL